MKKYAPKFHIVVLQFNFGSMHELPTRVSETPFDTYEEAVEAAAVRGYREFMIDKTFVEVPAP